VYELLQRGCNDMNPITLYVVAIGRYHTCIMSITQ